MHISVDRGIWGAAELFKALGEVHLFNGRTLTPAELRQTDALLVRSITRVDDALLGGTPVRFVGTATSGVDHIDQEYLRTAGVRFASAPGCNAAEVAEYVLTSLLLLAERRRFDLRTRTLGIMGLGQVGSRVLQWARAMGMRTLICDPPLQRLAPDAAPWVTSATLAREADIVTFHVPLTHAGPDATAGLVDADWLAAVKPGVILINTSRGEIIHEPALADAIDGGRLGGVILDVWCNEPAVDIEMVRRADVATPHLAGQTVDARRAAAMQMFDALSTSVNRVSVIAPKSNYVSEAASVAALDWPANDEFFRGLLRFLCVACDVARWDRNLRERLSSGSAAEKFDICRHSAADRRSLGSYRLTERAAAAIPFQLRAALGLQLST